MTLLLLQLACSARYPALDHPSRGERDSGDTAVDPGESARCTLDPPLTPDGTIATTADGAVWLTEAGRLYRYTLDQTDRCHLVGEWVYGDGTSVSVTEITASTEGELWALDYFHRLTRHDASGAVLTTCDTGLGGHAVAVDGERWWVWGFEEAIHRGTWSGAGCDVLSDWPVERTIAPPGVHGPEGLAVRVHLGGNGVPGGMVVDDDGERAAWLLDGTDPYWFDDVDVDAAGYLGLVSDQLFRVTWGGTVGARLPADALSPTASVTFASFDRGARGDTWIVGTSDGDPALFLVTGDPL